MNLKDLMENYSFYIKKEFNIQSSLRLLGLGAEGIVFSDDEFVYKCFFNIYEESWNFLKRISIIFDQNEMLYNIDLYVMDKFRCIRYKYEISNPIFFFDLKYMISFLQFCKKNNFVYDNIKPKNFIQLNSGRPKLIDYGESFKPYVENLFLNTIKRAFLMWKYPTMLDNEFRFITNCINHGECPKEIKGWEFFADSVL